MSWREQQNDVLSSRELTKFLTPSCDAADDYDGEVWTIVSRNCCLHLASNWLTGQKFWRERRHHLSSSFTYWYAACRKAAINLLPFQELFNAGTCMAIGCAVTRGTDASTRSVALHLWPGFRMRRFLLKSVGLSIGRLTLIHPMPIPGANQAHDIRDDETEQHPPPPPFNISSPNR